MQQEHGARFEAKRFGVPLDKLVDLLLGKASLEIEGRHRELFSIGCNEGGQNDLLLS
jgi:hypothetical protein